FDATWHLTLAPQYVAGLMVLVRGHLGDGVRTAASDLSGLDPAPGRNCLSIVATQLYRALESPSVTAMLARFDAVLVGGAALRPELRSRAEAEGVRVIETYGMSETCGGVVWDGAPLPGVEVTLGERGRIGIGGPTVFEGYLDDSGALRPSAVNGMVVTNDRGHFEAGRLVIDGRFDDVVISGGVNVDLAQVRRAVAALDPDTDVLAVDDAEWGARVVLFATSGTLASWRDDLRGTLPPAALPRQLVTLDALPRTGGGKPDRGILLGLVQS
ncbi:AMP-binding protein, partial [Tessaracoccus lubricantis]